MDPEIRVAYIRELAYALEAHGSKIDLPEPDPYYVWTSVGATRITFQDLTYHRTKVITPKMRDISKKKTDLMIRLAVQLAKFGRTS